MKPSKLRMFFILLISSLVTLICASVFHTQFVLAGLTALGVNIDLQTRFLTSLEDIIGLAPGYGSVIFISLSLGFGSIKLLSKLVQKYTDFDMNVPALFSYSAGGGVAMATMLLAMQPLLNFTLIAGARTTAGFAFQCIAGLIGGFCFAYWMRRYNNSFKAPLSKRTKLANTDFDE